MFYQGPLSSKQSIKTIKLKNWRALMENFHGIPGLLRYPLTGKNISWQSQEPQEYQIHEHPESRSRPPIYLGKRILKQTKNLANWKIQRCGCSQRKHSLSLQNSLVWAIDLLATRANKKINKYILWKRDTDSISIDAFSEIWEKYFIVSLLFASFGKYQNQKEINQRKS